MLKQNKLMMSVRLANLPAIYIDYIIQYLDLKSLVAFSQTNKKYKTQIEAMPNQYTIDCCYNTNQHLYGNFTIKEIYALQHIKLNSLAKHASLFPTTRIAANSFKSLLAKTCDFAISPIKFTYAHLTGKPSCAYDMYPYSLIGVLSIPFTTTAFAITLPVGLTATALVSTAAALTLPQIAIADTIDQATSAKPKASRTITLTNPSTFFKLFKQVIETSKGQAKLSTTTLKPTISAEPHYSPAQLRK